MKKLLFFVVNFLFACSILASQDRPEVKNNPEINAVFKYEDSNAELDSIFAAFATKLAEFEGNEQEIVEFIRGNAKEHVDLVKYIKKSIDYVAFKIEFAKLVDKFKLKDYKKNIMDTVENRSSRVLTLMCMSGLIERFSPILMKYEDYIEFFSSKAVAQGKALSFFFLYLVNPILTEMSQQEPKFLETAAYIQRNVALRQEGRALPKTRTTTLIAGTFNLINKKFDRKDYQFSDNFFQVLRSCPKAVSYVVDTHEIMVNKNILLPWLMEVYKLNKFSSMQILDRLMAKKIQLQESLFKLPETHICTLKVQ